jgi:N-acetylmuramic acid 6-phosphate etherase
MHNPLTTEASNPASAEIDRLSALEIVRLMNAEDARVAAAVADQAEPIAQAIEAIAERFRRGGRLIYLGAGTSGRLGVLDASECPPTFNSPPEQVVGLIAGGPAALTRAIEGAEDRPELAVEELERLKVDACDVVLGIATSGRTPYVIGGLRYARQHGAFTISLTCNSESQAAAEAELAITPIVGPEVISGSTRLKAGTATKLVLNMLTTGAMVRSGKTYGNLMVDLRATNSKLRARTARIAAALTGLDEAATQALLTRCDGELKTAIVVQRCETTPQQARRRLQAVGGQLRQALEMEASALALPPSTGNSSEVRPAASCGSPLLLGIDGGGSATVAVVAAFEDERLGRVLGRGEAGPSNPQVVGYAASMAALEAAVRDAFRDAGLSRCPAASACLALAGAGRDRERSEYERWAASRNLAAHFLQVHDALPVLAAGTDEGWGIAVVSGTGSLIYGADRAGRTARAGGWGYLLGDEGSGYWTTLESLRAAARAADGRGPATALQARMLAALDCKQTSDLVAAVYGSTRDRRELAALAAVTSAAAAAGDAVARSILGRAAEELSLGIAAVARELDLVGQPFPLALAGGVLSGCVLMRDLLTAQLQQEKLLPSSVRLVEEPALGAAVLAAKAIGARAAN